LLGFGSKGDNECDLWGCELVLLFFAFSIGLKTATHLHAADTQRKADTQVVTVGPFDREGGVGGEEEDAKRENGNTDPASDIDSLRGV
jgi:hypothetical protein